MISGDALFYICLAVTFVTIFRPLSVFLHWISLAAYCFIFALGIFYFKSVITTIFALGFGIFQYVRTCELQDAYDFARSKQEEQDARS